MIHLMIDTNIYRQKPKLDSPEFKALSYLAKSGELTIHVPYMVENEFGSQLDIEQEQIATTTLKNIKLLRKNVREGEIKQQLDSIVDFFDVNFKNIVSERRKSFIYWLKENGAVRYGLSKKESRKSFEAYFQGKPPFKVAKNRKDIPDSFIYQKVKKLNSAFGKSLYLIAQDGSLFESFSKLTENSYKSLKEFILLDEVQDILKGKVIDEHLEIIVKTINKKLIKDRKKIITEIENELLSDKYNSIGDWIEEINLTGVNTPHNLEFSEYIEYYGNGLFVTNFEIEVELMNEKFMDIHDAFDLDQEKNHIEIMNDHVASVESTNNFHVNGKLEIEIDLKISGVIKKEQLLKYIENSKYNIAELEDFEILD